MEALSTKWLQEVVVGSRVRRSFGGGAGHDLLVTELTDKFIVCGAWTFCRQTGIEIDEELGWGPLMGVSGSYLTGLAIY